MSYVHDGIDQWMDWGGHTVTVDPIRNERWIQEGDNGLHDAHIHKDKESIAKDTLALQAALSGMTDGHDVRVYQPSTKTLDKLPKFISRRYSHRGEVNSMRGWGELPVIIATERANEQFMNKSVGQLTRECFENQHHIADRVFDRGGLPDVGLPVEGDN